MVDDWHHGSLKIVESQRSHTFIANCEHLGDFGVENVDGASGRSLPNDIIIGEVAKSIELLQTKKFPCNNNNSFKCWNVLNFLASIQ
jgi:hypothetical protein